MNLESLYTKRNRLEKQFIKTEKIYNSNITPHAKKISLDMLDSLDTELIDIENKIFLQSN
jgi:hypothetical protein